MKKSISILCIFGVVIAMSVYSANGTTLSTIFDKNGNEVNTAYDKNNAIVHESESYISDIPVPSGNLYVSETIPLPDLYETGKGFTCTGLAYDGNYYYVGDIGTLSGVNYRSQIVVTPDFVNVERTIPLYSIYSGFQIVQGVAYDATSDTLWCVDAGGNKVYNLTKNGVSISSFAVSRPTGIACSSDGTLWILDYNHHIIHMSRTGTILDTFTFQYNENLDQCFLDEGRGLLYLTAGENYTGRNNVYCFNINTHEQYIACTVDSYSVEGIWLGDTDKMIILNDGLYHDASIKVNQANIYEIAS